MRPLDRAHFDHLGFEVGAHALHATAVTNALDHQAEIAAASVLSIPSFRLVVQPLIVRHSFKRLPMSDVI
jgi:hypothetical protein